MAIYHTRVKTFSRAQGHSSAAAAAYRAGLLIVDERTGTKHDYRRRGGVVETRCIAPDEAPDWAFVPSQLWAAAEAAERRKDATVAREFEIALPHELNDMQRSALVSALCRGLVERYRFAVQASIHAPDTPEGLNYHAHILATTRRVEEAGLTDKTRELDGGASGRVEVEWTREMVATTINAHLAAAQLQARVDHRSLEAQADAALARGDVAAAVALTRQPTQHVGKDATALHRRGEGVERVEVNAAIQDGNEEAFAALLAKYEQDGRAVPTPDGHSQERARRERKRDAAVTLSADAASEIRVVRGLGSTSEEEPKLLATPDGRRQAADAAFEEAARLWDEGFIASFDLALKSTAVVIKERATLTVTFVSQAPFVVYVRELVRRLKRLKHDVSRLARRKAAAQRAQSLLHQAQQALEQFYSEQPRALWSRREWAKRRTRRLAAVALRSKEMAAASKAIGSAARRTYEEEALKSAAALEAWSNDILRHYPLPTASDGGDVAAPPPESDPFTEAAEVPLVLEPETPIRKKRGPSPRLH